MRAGEQFPVNHDAHAGTGTQGHRHDGGKTLPYLHGCAQGIAVGVVVHEDGDVKAGFQGFLEGNHIPGGNVGRIVHDALYGVCQGRDADSDLLHAGNQEPLYLVSQIDECIIQGCCFREGRDLQLFDNLRPVYKAQVDGCSADVDTECHLNRG